MIFTLTSGLALLLQKFIIKFECLLQGFNISLACLKQQGWTKKENKDVTGVE